jgi:hypothetical protein
MTIITNQNLATHWTFDATPASFVPVQKATGCGEILTQPHTFFSLSSFVQDVEDDAMDCDCDVDEDSLMGYDMVEVEEMDFVDFEDSLTPMEFFDFVDFEGFIVEDGDDLDGVCRRLLALVLS